MGIISDLRLIQPIPLLAGWPANICRHRHVPPPPWSTVIALVSTFPGNGTLSTGVTNPGAPLPGITSAPPANLTQAPGATNVPGQICAEVLDQTQPPASVLMVHNHSLSHSNATAPGVTTPEQQLVCADGTGPDPTTGLCADGSQPQSQPFNATPPGVTTAEQQLVCADGTAPDPTTGLCADGSQPQPFQCHSSWCYYC